MVLSVCIPTNVLPSAALLFQEKRTSDLCKCMHMCVSVCACVLHYIKRKKFSYSAQPCLPPLSYRSPCSLLHPSFGLHLSPSFSCCRIVPPRPSTVFSSFHSLPPKSQSFHSFACHSHLKIGSSTPAEHNTTTTASQHDHLKQETHRPTW